MTRSESREAAFVLTFEQFFLSDESAEDIIAGASECVGTLAIHLDRRDGRGHLHTVPTQRRKRSLDDRTMEHFINLTGGKDPTEFIEQLRQETPQQAKDHILEHRELFRLLGETHANHGRPVVISNAPDELVSHTRGYGSGSRPEDYLDAFADYVKTHLNEVAALNIVCTRPKELTRESLRDLRLTLDREGFTTQQLNTAISELTNEEITADIFEAHADEIFDEAENRLHAQKAVLYLLMK